MTDVDWEALDKLWELGLRGPAMSTLMDAYPAIRAEVTALQERVRVLTRDLEDQVSETARMESRHVYYHSDRYPDSMCYYCPRTPEEHHPDSRAEAAEQRVRE